jgi:hypothetical protein
VDYVGSQSLRARLQGHVEIVKHQAGIGAEGGQRHPDTKPRLYIHHHHHESRKLESLRGVRITSGISFRVSLACRPSAVDAGTHTLLTDAKSRTANPKRPHDLRHGHIKICTDANAAILLHLHVYRSFERSSGAHLPLPDHFHHRPRH